MSGGKGVGVESRKYRGITLDSPQNDGVLADGRFLRE
jgi:hypothetical protein